MRIATGTRYPAIERAADMGERREVTALVIEVPREAPSAVIERAAEIIERWGGQILRR